MRPTRTGTLNTCFSINIDLFPLVLFDTEPWEETTAEEAPMEAVAEAAEEAITGPIQGPTPAEVPVPDSNLN